jgi:hypothetical protein
MAGTGRPESKQSPNNTTQPIPKKPDVRSKPPRTLAEAYELVKRSGTGER